MYLGCKLLKRKEREGTKKIKMIFSRRLNMWMFVLINIDFEDDVCIKIDVRANFDEKWVIAVMNNSFKMPPF